MKWFYLLIGTVFLIWGAGYLSQDGVIHDQANIDIVKLVLGESRSMLGNLAIEQADKYYHGGVGHADEEEHNCLIDGEPDEHEDGEHGDAPSSENRGWFSWLNRQIHPQNATHLEKSDQDEMMIWLWAASTCDPNNVDAFDLSAYWVQRITGDYDMAHKILDDGLEHNPGNWQLLVTKSIFLRKQNRLDESLTYVYEALCDMDKLLTSDEDVRFEYIAQCRLLGKLLLMEGRQYEAKLVLLSALRKAYQYKMDSFYKSLFDVYKVSIGQWPELVKK